MTAPGSEELRMLIREVIGEIAPQLQALTTEVPVSISDDVELAGFVRQVVDLLDSPLMGPLVRSGSVSFRLQAGQAASDVASRSSPTTAVAGDVETIEVERGVLSERIVAGAITSSARLVLGPSVVITPLAKEQIRKNSLDVVRLP